MEIDEDYFSDESDNEDVFARHATNHPAIQQSLAIAPDIYRPLFDDFLNGPIFARWLKYKELWQLDIVGGPGSGKSTFAALAARHIHEVASRSGREKIYLATVYIRDSPIESELAFVEDVLRIVFSELTPSHADIGSGVLERYKEYKRARFTGRKVSFRISLIAQALQERIAEVCAVDQAFLILDNLDHCSAPLKELIVRELAAIQQVGLKIMLTSRLPRYENHGTMDKNCDFNEEHFSISPYWHCRNCKKDICEICKGDETNCRGCGCTSPWIHPDFFTIFLDSIAINTLQQYVKWDLEREHGDLGFGTLEHAGPPLSSFGAALRKSKPGILKHLWVEELLNYVGPSVVQVKLALDRIHRVVSPDQVDLSPERLPANVQAIFNHGIDKIMQQSKTQSALALKSIAVVGKTGSMFEGIPISSLAESIMERRHKSSKTYLTPRSAEDVLEACNGYLMRMGGNGETNIVAFHKLFHLYVLDEYNEELVMAHAQLRTSKIPRSVTHKPKAVEEAGQSESWSDVIEGLKRYRTPKLPSRPGPGSPSPSRRESSVLVRSQTFLPAREVTGSSYEGLGFDYST